MDMAHDPPFSSHERIQINMTNQGVLFDQTTELSFDTQWRFRAAAFEHAQQHFDLSLLNPPFPLPNKLA